MLFMWNLVHKMCFINKTAFPSMSVSWSSPEVLPHWPLSYKVEHQACSHPCPSWYWDHVFLDLWFQCWFVEEGCLAGTSHYLICSDLRSSADQCVLSLYTWAEYLTVTFTIQMSPRLCNTQCRVRNGVLRVEYESKWRDAAWSCRDHGENSSGSL